MDVHRAYFVVFESEKKRHPMRNHVAPNKVRSSCMYQDSLHSLCSCTLHCMMLSSAILNYVWVVWNRGWGGTHG